MKSILKKLQEDKHYYGAYGRQFLSNSNIGILLNNPAEFGKEGVETLPMLHGRYFHVSMLEQYTYVRLLIKKHKGLQRSVRR